ncbi:hypothetical protein ACOJBO_22375 [Rhizobium beringeri]
MSDIEPGKHEGARHLDAADDHGRQFAIEAAREVAPHLLDRLFDDIVIVQQPFCRRRDRLAGFDVGRRGPVDAQDFPSRFPLWRAKKSKGANAGSLSTPLRATASPIALMSSMER